MDFLVGGLAATGAAFFSNPFDVLKTRMQLQGELKPRGQHAIHYKDVANAAYIITKNEGVFALQKGLLAAALMHGLRNSIKLGSYQWLTNKGYICDSEHKTIFYKSLLGSAFGGAVGAFVSNPFYLISTQMQSRAAEGIAVGFQHKHASFLKAFRTIYLGQGIRGLWRGANANVVRTIVGASTQLTSFSESKDALRHHEVFQKFNTLTAFFASSASGTCQTVVQTPFDLVCIRLNNQYVDANGKGVLYTGMINCFTKTIQSEGFFGLYKGFMANYIRIGRHTTCCLVFWEILKDFQVKYIYPGEDGKCYHSTDEIVKT